MKKTYFSPLTRLIDLNIEASCLDGSGVNEGDVLTRKESNFENNSLWDYDLQSDL